MNGDQGNIRALRERALKALALGQVASDAKGELQGAKLPEVMEELRVYQAELEIQNLELREAQGLTSLALNKYRALFERLPLPAVLVDDRGFILEANLRALEFLKLPTHVQLQHRSVLQLFDIEDRAMLHNALNRKAFCVETLLRMRLKLGGGDSVPCDIHFIQPEETDADSDKRLLVFVDQSAQKALSESELRYRYVMEATGDGIWDWDLVTDKVTHNARWYEILGIAEVGGQHSMEAYFSLVYEQDRDAVRKAMLAGATYCHEHRIQFPDGRVVWVLDRGRVVERSRDGRPVRMVGSLIDVTLRVEQELGLLRAKEQAEAASSAKSRFLAVMSHELRTPLNGILGMAQLLLEPEVSSEERQENVTTLLSSGQSLTALLNDILDLSKVEEGAMALDLHAVSPVEILQRVRVLFSAAARQKGLTLTSHWKGVPEAMYRGDSTRLIQMLTNLVSNALKFTERGDVQIIAEEAQRDAGFAELEFSVKDTGIGLSEAQQEQLFKPFSQVDVSISRSYGGTGLGLALVKTLAGLMDGEVGVDSVLGEGSRFWFRIRAAIESAVVLKTGEEPRLSTAGRPIQHSGRVLVVEDNAINSGIAVAMLRKLGLSSVVAENGLQALQLLEEPEAFDVVLMDVQMPVMNGYEATRKIREKEVAEGKSRLPIIAITANAYDEDRKCCADAGMDAFLPKPINLQCLRELLVKWIGSGAEASGANSGGA
ncbi:MAG: ATP-binding protein [Verrucomicrobiota bacterium]